MKAMTTPDLREAKVVPKEPTEEMLRAAHDGPIGADDYEMKNNMRRYIRAIWYAMWDAISPRREPTADAEIAGILQKAAARMSYGWIAVEERLPSSHEMVLIVTPQSQRGIVQYGYYDYMGREWMIQTSIGPEPVVYTGKPATHWMPLPAAPTAGGTNANPGPSDDPEAQRKNAEMNETVDAVKMAPSPPEAGHDHPGFRWDSECAACNPDKGLGQRLRERGFAPVPAAPREETADAEVDALYEKHYFNPTESYIDNHAEMTKLARSLARRLQEAQLGLETVQLERRLDVLSRDNAVSAMVKMRKERDTALREAEALRADAERWQYLYTHQWDLIVLPQFVGKPRVDGDEYAASPSELRDAIDASKSAGGADV